MKTVLISLVCLVFNTVLIAQETKWGKPTKEELNLKVCIIDSAANAVVLYENESIEVKAPWAYIRVYRKIKILTSNGIHQANIQIPFYHKDNYDDIRDVKAQTINTDNGSTNIIELNKDEVFTKIHNSLWSSVQFTFPSVKEGSILEYTYTLATKRIFSLTWCFQNELPTIYSEVKFNAASHLKYNILMSGDILKNKYRGQVNAENTWSLNNIPGYEAEKNVFCYNDYIAKIQFQPVSYETFEGGAYAKGLHSVDYLKTWDQLAKEQSEKFNFYLSRNAQAKEILDTIINVADTKEEKIKKIYRFVHSFISWNKYYTAFTIQTLNELLESRQGSSAEINLLLCLLLNKASINAFPVLISTKTNGKVNQSYPILEQFNHVLVAIEKDTSYTFMDAVNQSKNGYLVPFMHVNYWGYLINKKAGKWIHIDYPPDSKEIHFTTYKFNGSSVSIHVADRYSGYYALNYRRALRENNTLAADPVNFINNTVFKKDSSSRGDIQDDYSDFSEHFYFSSKFKLGDKIYLNLNSSNDLENPYKQRNRLFPVELDFPFSEQRIFNILIPNGYVVKALPENMTIVLPDNAGMFLYNASYLGNQVFIDIKWNISTPILPKEYYYYLKEFYNRLIMKMNEPVVIEKKI